MAKKRAAENLSEIDIERAWTRSVQNETQILSTDLTVLRDQFEDELAFGPLLPGTIATVNSNQIIADMYRQLIRTLRNTTSTEQKWKLLAMWLKQEDIWQPKDFLPKVIRKRLLGATLGAFETIKKRSRKTPKQKTNRLIAKPAEILYALVAEAWKPYFELMHVAYNRLTAAEKSAPLGALAELGFAKEAVSAALLSMKGLRAPTDTACRFAATRLDVGEDSVLAAHSKIYHARPVTQ